MVPSDRPPVKREDASSSPDDARTAFNELVEARRRGDLASSKAALRRLKVCGYSVVLVDPRPVGEARR